MATALSSIESQAREHLKETTASFWSSAELIAIINKGIKDLWGAIIDLHQEHYITVDASNVSLAASTASLTGVPTDVFRVLLIEPRDTTTTPGRSIVFTPRDYNSPEFINARSRTAVDPSGGLEIFYAITQAGAPVGAPTILIAPQISSALNLRLVYVPVIATKVAGDDNPIPGESDQALINWCVAWARAKEREDRSPDPAWLAAYSTEKGAMLTRLTPRQTQEPDVVGDLWGAWF